MFATLPATAKDFYESVLFHAIASLKLNRYGDNFDAERFNLDGVDRSKTFNVGMHVFYFDWFTKNVDSLFSAYSCLGNESSRRLFLYLIAFRLGGHLSVKLPVPFSARKAEYAEYKTLENATPSSLAADGMFGNLKHFDFEYKNSRYVADCLSLEHCLFRGQYFYAADGVTIAPEPGDSVIDGGACTGDTAAVFSNAVGPSGRVYAFDPVADHLQILSHNTEQFPHQNVTVMPFGLSNKNVLAEPIVLNQYQPGFNSSSQTVPLRSIDELVRSGEIPKIDFMKLDIEGAEMDTLLGAEASIEHDKPKLAISLYHKPNDLFEIVLHIKDRFPFYSCYLDHYTIHEEETVLYCKA